MSDRLKIVQVGLGGWGWSWTDIVQRSEDCTLVAAVDTNPDRLKAAAERYDLGERQLFTSLGAAVEAARPDACLVVVPPEVHAPVTIDAARLGLHCLVEKPLADDPAGGQAMVEAAEASGVTLMVNQNYRYRRAATTVRKLLADGIIGEIGSVVINFQKAARFGGGFRETMDHPLVLDMAIHHFDQLRSFGFEPVEVMAQSWNPAWSWFQGDACANAVFRARNGARAVYTGSWVSQGWQTTWDGDWRIQGTEGEIHWANNRVEVLPTSVFTSVFVPGAREAEGRLSVDLLPLPVEDRLAVLRDFASAIRDKRPPVTSGRDNLRTLATVLATRASIESGTSVEIH